MMQGVKMIHLIKNTRARIEHRKDAHVRRIYTILVQTDHLSLVEAYDTAHNRVYHDGANMKTLKAKYAEVLKRLHTCRPEEKKALKTLLNYYYNLINCKGV